MVMRRFLLFILLLGPLYPAAGQSLNFSDLSEGDELFFNTDIEWRFKFTYGKYMERVAFVATKGDTLTIEQLSYPHIKARKGDTSGWIALDDTDGLMSSGQLAKQQRQREAEREAAERNRAYEARLREQGFGLKLIGIGHSTNSAGGVSVGVTFKNITESKRIKYISLSIMPFNGVGDVVRGRMQGQSLDTVRGIGPIEPQRRASYDFDNVWYNPVVDCIEVRKIVVEYMDGSSFTYVNDLREIDEYADGFHFRGDCQNP